MAGKTIAPELILANGRIYTLNPDQPWAEAIAITKGRISAIGSNDQIQSLAGAETRIVDLSGQMAMPGFIDVHNHILMGGQTELFELRFPGTASLADILRIVREAAEKAAPEQWIIGSQWGADMMVELNTEAALAQLDEASLGRPVLLRDETVHNRWVNSAAMRATGISHNMPDPPHGAFGRDPATGKLTGIMIESAAGLVERAASDGFTEVMAEAAIRKAVAVLNGFGVTAFQDAASTLQVSKVLKNVDSQGALTAWAVTSLPLVEPAIILGLSGEPLLAMRDDFRSDHVFPNFTKLFMDGVPGAQTSAFHDAYRPDPAHPHGHRGELLVSLPDLVKWIDRSEDLGMGLKIHCTGDAAVTRMLDAVEVVRHFRGPAKVLHHIAHASYILPDDIRRFATLDVVADLCPMIWFPTTFLEGHRQVMGKERAERFWPVADLQKAGTLIAGGSDWPVIPNPNPFIGIEGLVTRENPDGSFPGVKLWGEQAIDLASAIEIYTLLAARAMGLADLTGSLVVGKSADIIVLDQNVFDIPPHAIGKTRIQKTYFEGREVFNRSVV